MKRVGDQLGESIRYIGKKKMQKMHWKKVLAQLIKEGREENFEKWKNGKNINRWF